MHCCRRLFLWLFLGLVLVAVLVAAHQLWRVLALEVAGAINADGVVYLIVGRGLLNGLIPYADLFESKPPGMFLLSVLSLVATGDDRGALLLQVGVLIALPALLAVFAWHELRARADSVHRRTVIAIATLVGMLLALVVEERCGGFQTESFGAFFASLYLLHVMVRPNASAKSAIAVNAGLLLATVGLKEPFLLTMLAGLLLVVRDTKHFREVFLIPLVVAIACGAAVLGTLGYLGPYLTIYLPAMLDARISADVLEPLWIRGFAVGRVLAGLAKFSLGPLFGWLFAILWLTAPLLKTHRREISTLFLALVGSCVAYFCLVETGVLLTVLHAVTILPMSFHHAAGFMALRLSIYILLLLLTIVLLRWEQRRGLMLPTLLGCAALYLTSVAIGVANYLSWHWGFAVPVLFALVLLLVRDASQQPRWPIPLVVTGILSCIMALTYQPSPHHLGELESWRRNDSSAVTRPVSRRFDELLDHCHIATYFSLDAEIELADSRHSPLGPIFVMRDHTNYLPPDHPLLQQTYANIRSHAQLIVVESGSHLDDLHLDLKSKFTSDAPACAQEFLPLDHLILYFRKS